MVPAVGIGCGPLGLTELLVIVGFAVVVGVATRLFRWLLR